MLTFIERQRVANTKRALLSLSTHQLLPYRNSSIVLFSYQLVLTLATIRIKYDGESWKSRTLGFAGLWHDDHDAHVRRNGLVRNRL